MQVPSSEGLRYFVKVTRRGPPAEPFGWNICRDVDSVEMHRSTQTFATCIEALLESARIAATLARASLLRLVGNTSASGGGLKLRFQPHVPLGQGLIGVEVATIKD